MVELKVRLGPKGQIVIPKIFRNLFRLYPGGEVIITIERDKGVLIKQVEDPIAILEEVSGEAARRRKGSQFKYDKKEFYEQYEKRAKKAGL